MSCTAQGRTKERKQKVKDKWFVGKVEAGAQ